MSEATVVAIVGGSFGLLFAVIGSLLVLGIRKLLEEMKSLWEEIKLIKVNQTSLRASLPREFLMVNSLGYEVLHDGILEMKKSFESFAADCRAGRCGGKKP